MDRSHKLLASASYQPQGVGACRSTTEIMNIDRFSYLPDPVAHHILSFLPITDLTRLGCVSKNCRELYLSSPSLNFDEFSQANLFMDIEVMSCLDRFLFIHRGVKKIQRFRIRWNSFLYSEDEKFRMMTWIHNAVRCNVEVLHLELKGNALLFPSFVFLCGSLKSLLVDMDCKILKAPSVTYFSNLEYLNLKNVHIEDEGIFKWISCCCKCIKELHLKHVRGIKSFTIESSSLISFWFNYTSCFGHPCHLSISGEKLQNIAIHWGFRTSHGSKSLSVFAPNLKRLGWLGRDYDSPHQADIDHDFSITLESIHRVKVLILNTTTMALFKRAPMPATLENVRGLCILIGGWLDILVPTIVLLFGKMPNLSTLNLNHDSLFRGPKTYCCGFDMRYWELQNLAFIHQLKKVTIELSDGSNGIEFAKYVLEHAQNLKKMVIVHSPQQSNCIRKLNKSKLTSNATIVFKKIEKEEANVKEERRVVK